MKKNASIPGAEPSETLRPPRSSRRTEALLFLAVFVFGGICGVSGAVIGLRRIMDRTLHDPDARSGMLTWWVAKRLDLDASQRDQVREILRRHASGLQALRLENGPRQWALADDMDRDVGALLSDAQRSKWEKMMERYRRNWLPPPPTGKSQAPR